jgi:capsular exopolysaccharide synthesis family protein
MESIAVHRRGSRITRESSDLRSYLRVLNRRKVTIFVVFVLVVAPVLGYSLSQSKRYTATAAVLIQPNGTPPQLGGTNTTTLQPSDIQTQVQLITSAPVKSVVVEKLGRKAPDVSVNPVGQTDVINVAATSARPRDAAAIANAYANAYVDVRRLQAVNSLVGAAQQIQSRITDLDRQIGALNDQVASASSSQRSSVQQSVTPQLNALSNEEAALKTQLGQLQLNSAVQTGSAQVVTPAAIPTSPSSPRTLRNVLVGAAIGLLLGIGVALLRDYLDDSVRTKEEMERAGGGLPVLGVIPSTDNWRDKSVPTVVSLTAPGSPTAESYRALRTSIQFLGTDRPIRRLQITSPSAEEGKTTTVANLGVALAAAGQRVIVVCCDLRRPRIHEFYGLSNNVGLTSVLLGHRSFADGIQPVQSQERLAVLASGNLPPNPSELLQSRQMAQLLQSLEARADIVLLDCPPILPVTDAAALSTHVDATLVVASASGTHGRVLSRALEVLAQVGAPLVGTVLNNVAAKDTYGYAHKYEYYSAANERLGVNGRGVATNGHSRRAKVQEG